MINFIEVKLKEDTKEVKITLNKDVIAYYYAGAANTTVVHLTTTERAKITVTESYDDFNRRIVSNK